MRAVIPALAPTLLSLCSIYVPSLFSSAAFPAAATADNVPAATPSWRRGD